MESGAVPWGWPLLYLVVSVLVAVVLEMGVGVEGDLFERTQTADARPAPRYSAVHSCNRIACKLRSRCRRAGYWLRRRGRCRGKLAGRVWRRRRGWGGGLFPGTLSCCVWLKRENVLR